MEAPSMETTAKHDSDFIKEVTSQLPEDILQMFIAWVGRNLSPSHVFGKTELFEAVQEYEPDDVFKRKELMSWASNQNPDDIFISGELDEWAEKAGYQKYKTSYDD